MAGRTCLARLLCGLLKGLGRLLSCLSGVSLIASAGLHTLSRLLCGRLSLLRRLLRCCGVFSLRLQTQRLLSEDLSQFFKCLSQLSGLVRELLLPLLPGGRKLFGVVGDGFKSLGQLLLLSGQLLGLPGHPGGLFG